MKRKIVITGGEGDFPKQIIKVNSKFKIFTPSKKKLDILKFKSIISFLKQKKPNYLIHSAALTNPMSQHKYKIIDSINTNIVGTSNVAMACEVNKVKMIYISTNFVYPGKHGNYSEKDNLNPVNNYGWSKLGGECAVKLIKNHLILRICMTKDVYPHKIAYSDYETSFLTKSEAAKIVLKLINKRGVINVGGKKQSAYKFAKMKNQNVNEGKLSKKNILLIGKNTSINIKKLQKIIKK